MRWLLCGAVLYVAAAALVWALCIAAAGEPPVPDWDGAFERELADIQL